MPLTVSKKAVTLKDLARIAGVSPRTVSLVIRGEGRISQETTCRIKELAKSMNYHPDIMGRGLVQGKTFLLGAIVPFLDISTYTDIIKGILNRGSEKGYDVLVRISEKKMDREAAIVDRFLNRRVEGIIFYPNELAGTLYNQLLQNSVPLVQIGTRLGALAVPSIVEDDIYCGFIATEKLIQCGCRHIAFIGWDRSDAVRDRLLGYHKALNQYGIQVDIERSEVIGTGLVRGSASGGILLQQFGENAGRELLRKFSEVDGIFCPSDEMAVGVAKVCLEAGRKIPENLCIIGCDDLKIADFQIGLSLTTVAVSKQQIGEHAVDLLLKQINHESVESMIVRPYLIERNTTRQTSKL